MSTTNIKSDEAVKALACKNEYELKALKRKNEKQNLELDKTIAGIEASILKAKADGYDVMHLPEQKESFDIIIREYLEKVEEHKLVVASNKMVIKVIDKIMEEAKSVKTREEILKLLKSAGLLDIEKLKARLQL